MYFLAVRVGGYVTFLVPSFEYPLTLIAPENLQLYGLYVYYVVHICDFGMLRVNLMEIYMQIASATERIKHVLKT